MSEHEIGLREARTQIGKLVNAAEYAGQVTYITNHGRRVAAIVPIHHAPRESTMRIVSSTTETAAVDRAVAEEISDAIEAGHVVRESKSAEDGITHTFIRVVSYALDGEERWALVHEDPAEANTSDSANQAEVVAEYEKQVRELVAVSGWTFDETDVDLDGEE